MLSSVSSVWTRPEHWTSYADSEDSWHSREYSSSKAEKRRKGKGEGGRGEGRIGAKGEKPRDGGNSAKSEGRGGRGAVINIA